MKFHRTVYACAAHTLLSGCYLDASITGEPETTNQPLTEAHSEQIIAFEDSNPTNGDPWAEFDPFGIPGAVRGTGTRFEVTDSEWLNLTLESSESVAVRLESIPKMITIEVESADPTGSAAIPPQYTVLTLTGLEPDTEYHRYTDSYENHFSFLSDPSGTYSWEQDISSPHIIFLQTRKSTKVITPGGNGGDCDEIGVWNDETRTCTLTTNVAETVEVRGNGVTLEGAGHAIIGQDNIGNGLYIYSAKETIVRNVHVSGFAYGIRTQTSFGTKVSDSVSTGNTMGIIVLGECRNNTVTGGGYGIACSVVADNTVSDTRYGITGGDIVSNNTVTGSGVGIQPGYYSIYTGNTMSGNTQNISFP